MSNWRQAALTYTITIISDWHLRGQISIYKIFIQEKCTFAYNSSTQCQSYCSGLNVLNSSLYTQPITCSLYGNTIPYIQLMRLSCNFVLMLPLRFLWDNCSKLFPLSNSVVKALLSFPVVVWLEWVCCHKWPLLLTWFNFNPSMDM